MRRPAFAIPMVILLTIVMSLMIAVMLERNGAQRLQVRRTLESYNDHHMKKGVQEIVNAWLRTLPNAPLAELLGEDGKIVEISMLDGVRLTIFLEDGQRSIRYDASSIRTESQHIE
ncbi:MAG: hypothetical protein KDA28_06100, partial [Phycisphaerales bacterium]|nr:hypothetical protein [Phycisphaerales bacterium]